MATSTHHSTPSHELSTDSFLESVKHSKTIDQKHRVINDSSSEDSANPSLDLLRSQQLQKKLIRELDQCSNFTGNESQKFPEGWWR